MTKYYGPSHLRKYAANLRNRYHLTPEEYDARLAEQDGRCAICREKCATGRRLAVDHDRKCCPGKTSCGKCIRGLLCYTCNVRLGWVEKFLGAIMQYLKVWP
jgi:hypothetical protein